LAFLLHLHFIPISLITSISFDYFYSFQITANPPVLDKGMSKNSILNNLYYL